MRRVCASSTSVRSLLHAFAQRRYDNSGLMSKCSRIHTLYQPTKGAALGPRAPHPAFARTSIPESEGCAAMQSRGTFATHRSCLTTAAQLSGCTKSFPWQRGFQCRAVRRYGCSAVLRSDEPHPMIYKPLAVDYEPLSEKQMAEAYWNYAAEGYLRAVGPAFAPLHNQIAQKARVLMKDIYEPSVLDIGSINGQPGLAVAEATESDEVFVTDLATLGREELLSTLAKSEYGREIKFLKADADDLQFDADAFDLVTCCMVLSVCDHEAAIWDIFRVLKPGGAVVAAELGEEEAVDYLGPYLAALRAALPFHPSLPPSFGLRPSRLGKRGALVESFEEEGFVDVQTEDFTFAMDFGATEEEVWRRFEGHLIPMIRYLRLQNLGEEEPSAAAAADAKDAFIAALRAQGAGREAWFQRNVARVYVACKQRESFWDFLRVPVLVPVKPK